MADNITAPAAGAVLATDEVAGVHYPKNKLSFGASDSATDVTASTPLPVDSGTSASGSYAAVTPSDSVALTTPARALYVGSAGDLAVKNGSGGTAVTFKSVPAGMLLPVKATHVLATGTTASSLVALA